MTDTFRGVAPGGVYTFQMEVTLLANSINMMSLALVSIKLNSQEHIPGIFQESQEYTPV